MVHNVAAFSVRTQPAQIRIIVADDHPLTRMGIRSALAGGGFDICAEAGDGDDAVAAAIEFRPDVCLLDVRMPGDGIAAAARIKEALPETAIIMMTAAGDDTFMAAVRAGAVGFLLKENVFRRLPETILRVLKGEAAVPRHLTTRLLGEVSGRHALQARLPTPPGVALSRRELEVLELFLQGLDTHAIAERLFVSQATVRSYMSRLLRKFQAPDRTALRELFAE